MSEEGDLLLTSLRPRAMSGTSGTPPGQQSLLAVMNRFVAAVEEMDGAIMIPCKLQDMYLDTPPCLPPPCNGRTTSATSENPTAATNGHPKAATNGHSNGHINGHMNGHSEENGSALVPLKDSSNHSQQNSVNGYGNNHKGATSTDPKNTNLYTYYGMLRAIKAELVRGPSEDEDEEGEEGEEGRTGKGEEDDVAKQTATMFRHHLTGLFGVLRQMTGTAHVLTAKYQSEIGDSSLSSTKNLSHFTL